jgi:hypothetical protein
MQNTNKDNLVGKRKRTESFDIEKIKETPKLIKIENCNKIHYEEITNDLQRNHQLEIFNKKNPIININPKTTNFFSSISKTDILNVIWKPAFLYFPFINEGKILEKEFNSKRMDNWLFKIYFDKQKNQFILLVKVEDIKKCKKNIIKINFMLKNK